MLKVATNSGFFILSLTADGEPEPEVSIPSVKHKEHYT